MYLSSSFSQTQQPLLVLPCSTPTSASGSCQVWQTCNTVGLSLPIIDSCGPLLFYLVHVTSHLSSFSFQTQQPFIMLNRSTPTSATGSCQVWQTCGAVRLALPIVDSCGPLLFYFGPFHILHVPFFFFLPNTTAFTSASLFNADISKWVVSSVTNMQHSRSFLANYW